MKINATFNIFNIFFLEAKESEKEAAMACLLVLLDTVYRKDDVFLYINF